VFGVAAVVGPSLGAFLVEHVAWQVVFWVNVPVGVAAIAMISAFLQENVEARRRRIDWVGSLLMIVTCGAAVTMLFQGSALSSGAMIGLALACGFGVIALVVHEARITEPMLAVELLRDQVILIGSVGSGLAGAVMMGISAFLPTYVQGAMGRSAMTAGIVLGAMSVTWALSSILGGRLMVRTSYRLAAILGGLSLIAGSAMLLWLTPLHGVMWATVASLTIGTGMGLCNTAFIVSIQAAVPWGKRGAATSSCLFLRFIGQALGAAAFGSLLNATIKRHGPDTAHLIDQLMEPASRALLAEAERGQLVVLIADGLHNAYWLALALSAATLALVWFLPRKLSPAQQSLR
jgi:MFS family permease